MPIIVAYVVLYPNDEDSLNIFESESGFRPGS